MRISHAVDVAHLTREVEDHVLSAHGRRHRRGVAHIGHFHAHAIGDAVDVEPVAAVVVDERIDDRDLRVECHELARQVAADESEPAGDEDPPSGVEGPVRL